MEEYINKIINADCLDILKQLPDESVDCCFTDVPYKQEFHNRGMAKSRNMYKKIGEYGSDLFIDYSLFFRTLIKKLRKINFFTFCNKETLYDFISLAKENSFSWQILTFCKTSPTPFVNNQWLCDVEFGIHIFKNLEVLGDYTTKRSFSVMNNFKEEGIDHPTPKKIKECVRILKNITSKDDLVLDPFSGSGTTAIACHNLKRRFICIEKDFDYWQASVKRLKEHKRQLTLF